MVTTVKQCVTVEAGGRVALQSPELHEGESAQVIVMVDRPSDVTAANGSTPDERLRALNQLRQSLKLSVPAAERWEAEVRAERAASRVSPAQ